MRGGCAARGVRPRASRTRRMRRDRPVTSATSASPKWCSTWSSAVGTAGNAARRWISASRMAIASWLSMGLPSGSCTGRDSRFPSSSAKVSCRRTGKACSRKSSTYSRGVRSTERSSHSDGGISAMRRSMTASPVETSWITGARAWSRSRWTARISDGHFIEVSRCPKKRCLAPSKAERAADFALRLSVSVPDTMPVAFSASSMFL